ncbi:MAG: hypothetical protein DME77_08115 [Verrucomicrobia bacterium]|nr:MAG: hypothetical protein DME77_08115 [Verrucomicrobiota bacterium]
MIARVTRKPRKKQIVILGGGFGGVYAAMYLEKLLARRSAVEICLVSHDNFFLFTPMLHEIAASDLEITNIVTPSGSYFVKLRYWWVTSTRSICQTSGS